MVNSTGPEFCSGVGPGVRFKGRAGCSSSVMCEVCRFRTLRPIYLAICRIRKSCRGLPGACRPPRLRYCLSDLVGTIIDCRDATNESTPILATPQNMTIVKSLNFLKTPAFPVGTSGHSLYPHHFVGADGCNGEGLPFAMEDLPADLGWRSRHLEGVAAFGRVVRTGNRG